MRKYTTYAYYTLVICPIFVACDIMTVVIFQAPITLDHGTLLSLGIQAFSWLGQWIGIFVLLVIIVLRVSQDSTLLLRISVVLGCIVATTVLYIGVFFTVFLGGQLVLNDRDVVLLYHVYFWLSLLVLFVEVPMLSTVFIAKLSKHHRDIVVGVAAILGVFYLSLIFLSVESFYWWGI